MSVGLTDWSVAYFTRYGNTWSTTLNYTNILYRFIFSVVKSMNFVLKEEEKHETVIHFKETTFYTITSIPFV